MINIVYKNPVLPVAYDKFVRSNVVTFSKKFSGYLWKYRMLGGSPCHHSLARSRVADGRDGLQLWRLAANILNKQMRTNDKEWSSSLGVGRGTSNPSP
jgi:hypothetical protein